MPRNASITVFYGLLYRLGGPSGFFDVVERLNCGHYQRDIAKDYRLDPAYLCRALAQTVDLIAVPKPEISAELERVNNLERTKNDEHRTVRHRSVRDVQTPDDASQAPTGERVGSLPRLPAERAFEPRGRSAVL